MRMILMVVTFPRKECLLIEARIRKRFLKGTRTRLAQLL